MAEEKKDPPTPPLAPPPEVKPYAVFETSEQLNVRLERERKKTLKDLGYEDEAAAKAAFSELEKFRTSEAERKKAAMSEIERANAAHSEATARATKAEGEREEALLRAHLYRVCAMVGIPNIDYATWAVQTKLAAMGETDEELDAEVYLRELLKDPAQSAALGRPVAPAAPPAPGAPRVALPTTSPQMPAPGAPPAGNVPQAKTAFEMTPEEWAAKKSALGITGA